MAALEPRLVDVDYVEVECKSALNPYTGCEHRCSFCYVRAFELRADRPSDDRYGRTVRIKTNVAAVLRSELSRRSWRKETVVIGADTERVYGRPRRTRARMGLRRRGRVP